MLNKLNESIRVSGWVGDYGFFGQEFLFKGRQNKQCHNNNSYSLSAQLLSDKYLQDMEPLQ